tara:strand:+ start:3713 stop:4126 length:414 start_codon:yes stop_codon:yes gene_type:complete
VAEDGVLRWDRDGAFIPDQSIRRSALLPIDVCVVVTGDVPVIGVSMVIRGDVDLRGTAVRSRMGLMLASNVHNDGRLHIEAAGLYPLPQGVYELFTLLIPASGISQFRLWLDEVQFNEMLVLEGGLPVPGRISVLFR